MRIGPGWSKGSELLAIPGLGWRRLTRRGTDRNRPMLGEQRTASFRLRFYHKFPSPICKKLG